MELKSRAAPLFFAIGISLVTILSGCAVVSTKEQASQRERPHEEEPRAALSGTLGWSKYRSLALQYEKSEQLQMALFMWQVVDGLSLGNQEAQTRIRELEAKAHAEGEKHFAKGMTLSKEKAEGPAQREFLLALAFDPDHGEALKRLRQETTNDLTRYEVREGDTPVTVAKRIYGDPGMAVLVTGLNGLSGQGTLRSGSLLWLPVPERPVTAKTGVAAKVKARPVPTASDKVSAEQHYAAGVGYFLEQKLGEAAKEWETTLRLNPGHPNARRDLQKARNLMKRDVSK